MWKLPDGVIIRVPRQITINDIKYPASIFYAWPVSKLVSIGVYPFREERYDKRTLKATKYTDDVRENEIVRVYDTVPRDPEEIKINQEREELQQLRSSLASNQRVIVKVLINLYKVGRKNGAWAVADFNPKLVEMVKSIDDDLTRLEELETIYED